MGWLAGGVTLIGGGIGYGVYKLFKWIKWFLQMKALLFIIYIKHT